MKLSGKLYTFIVFALLYFPIVVVIFFSFNSTDSMSVFSGFSLRWYKTLFSDEKIFKALLNSLILAVSSSAISTIIGTAAAVGIFNLKNKKFKKAVMTVTNLPMMNPDIVTGVSMLLMFAFVGVLINGEILGFGTVLIAHVTFNLPYVILCILPKLQQMDKNLPEAAMDLGCTPLQAFLKVEFFEMLPGIAAGALMAFTLSLDDFVISYFAAGDTFQTLPILIYSMTKLRVRPYIPALFAIIFAIVFIMLFAKAFLSKEKKQAKAIK